MGGYFCGKNDWEEDEGDPEDGEFVFILVVNADSGVFA